MKQLYFIDNKELLFNFPEDSIIKQKISKHNRCWIEDTLLRHKNNLNNNKTFNEFHTYLKYKEITNVDCITISIKDLDKYDNKNWIAYINCNSISGYTELDFWKLLPLPIKNKLNKNIGNLFLFAHMEGYTTSFFYELYKKYLDHDISWNRLWYITSSLNAEELYNNWCIKNNIPDDKKINIISVCGWQGKFLFSDIEKLNDIRTYKNREKKFINLNRRLRPHRIFFVSYLQEEKEIQNGFVSFFKTDDLTNKHNITIDSCFSSWGDLKHCDKFLLEKINNGLKDIKQKTPLTIDINDVINEYCNTYKIISQQYTKCYYSIVSETHYSTSLYNSDENMIYEDSIFFSEKIFKPILHYHPFILISRPNSLKYLKKLGYQTFHPYIDESYDEETDPFKRMELIMKEVKRLNSLSANSWDKLIEQLYPILVHNYNRCSVNMFEDFEKTGLKTIIKQFL